MNIIIKISSLVLGVILLILFSGIAVLPARGRARSPAEYAGEISYRLSSMRVRQLHMRMEQSRDLQKLNAARRGMESSMARLQASSIRLTRVIQVHS